jgi:hypothetical protein
VLELLDCSGQRGLGDEQPLGGTPVVELLAEDGEVAQLAKGDAVLLVARDTLLGCAVIQACHATVDLAHELTSVR